MKPTIYDVAKEAGVSIATVSKIINNTGKISEPTRIKVLKIMKELNYYPSMIASALTGKRTNTLGLVIPDISNPFFSEMARTIEDRAHEQGLNVIMCSTDYNEEKEKKYIHLLQRKQVDGFIITSGFQSMYILEEFAKNNVPHAMLALDNPSISVNVVSVDDYKGGYLATDHLLSSGHRNIAIIAEEVHSSTLRLYGYRDAHEHHNIPVNERNIVKTVASIENGQKMIQAIFDREERPDAVFACNDLLAIGVIKGARKAGLSIPEDLSIVGFDNTILATTTVPELTTVAQPIAEMGKKMVDVLVGEIESPKSAKERILFVPELIIRGTTKKALLEIK
jgi:DNA-binding LacI/PurR family transcriptional regulator